jgi:hypothetical protein
MRKEEAHEYTKKCVKPSLLDTKQEMFCCLTGDTCAVTYHGHCYILVTAVQVLQLIISM